MPNRFEKVIQQASALPVEIQDEIIEQWMEDIESEMNWQKTLHLRGAHLWTMIG